MSAKSWSRANERDAKLEIFLEAGRNFSRSANSRLDLEDLGRAARAWHAAERIADEPAVRLSKQQWAALKALRADRDLGIHPATVRALVEKRLAQHANSQLGKPPRYERTPAGNAALTKAPR